MGDQLHEDPQYAKNCYYPIFVITDRGNDEYKKTFFLGNMFLDKYFIANEINEDNAVTIGIYNKLKPGK